MPAVPKPGHTTARPGRFGRSNAGNMNYSDARKPAQIASVGFYRTPYAVMDGGAFACQVYRMHFDFGLYVVVEFGKYISAAYIIIFGIDVKIVAAIENPQ